MTRILYIQVKTCAQDFSGRSSSNADKGTDKYILPSPYFSKSKVGQENLASAVKLAVK